MPLIGGLSKRNQREETLWECQREVKNQEYPEKYCGGIRGTFQGKSRFDIMVSDVDCN